MSISGKGLRAAVAGLALWLGACATVEVERVPIATPPPIPENSRKVPLRFGSLEFLLRRGTPVAETEFWSWECEGPYDLVTWGGNRTRISRNLVADLFHEELSAAGFDVTGGPSTAYAGYDGEDEARTEYLVSARVADLRLRLCRHGEHFLGGLAPFFRRGTSAEASLRVDWTVYSRLERRVVLRLSTRGYAESPVPVVDGDLLAMEQAFAAAAANLAAEPAFRAVAFEPREPPTRRPQPAESAFRPGAPAAAPEGVLVLDRLPAFPGPIAGHVEAVRAASVTVAAGLGHGSGVLIGREGWILTNHHVVGEAEQVRVIPFGGPFGGTAVTGRVVRRDAPRDVALVKIDGADLPALPVRDEPPRISEEVYAIGSPIREALSGTLTRGIVSAFRRDRLSGLELIQADVPIQGGSSGGPLVDARGNLIGLAVAVYVAGGMPTESFSLFIPVGDALDKLDIRLSTDIVPDP